MTMNETKTKTKTNTERMCVLLSIEMISQSDYKTKNKQTSKEILQNLIFTLRKT